MEAFLINQEMVHEKTIRRNRGSLCDSSYRDWLDICITLKTVSMRKNHLH